MDAIVIQASGPPAHAMGLMPGETILITGGVGMAGQAATAIARWRGADPVVAGRRRPDGVEHFIDTSSTDIREAVLELTGGRGADLALDTVGGALFGPALSSLRFGGRMVGVFSAPEPVDFTPAEVYNRQLHLTGLASVFMDGADVARIFDQLRPLFDRGFLAPPARRHCCCCLLYRASLISLATDSGWSACGQWDAASIRCRSAWPNLVARWRARAGLR
jgi:NADPH:quinone reductase-like Zn-dependent oxidoreductase